MLRNSRLKLDANEKALKEAESRALAADDLRTKLEAAEKALKEAEDKASASEVKITQLATREAGIVERLNALSNSFGTEKLGEKYSVQEDQREDSLLDSLTVLEMNCTLARNGLAYARQAFNRLFRHFFPSIEAPETFETLAKVFTADADPALNYRRVATKTGVEISIALAMHT